MSIRVVAAASTAIALVLTLGGGRPTPTRIRTSPTRRMIIVRAVVLGPNSFRAIATAHRTRTAPIGMSSGLAHGI